MQLFFWKANFLIEIKFFTSGILLSLLQLRRNAKNRPSLCILDYVLAWEYNYVLVFVLHVPRILRQYLARRLLRRRCFQKMPFKIFKQSVNFVDFSLIFSANCKLTNNHNSIQHISKAIEGLDKYFPPLVTWDLQPTSCAKMLFMTLLR